MTGAHTLQKSTMTMLISSRRLASRALSLASRRPSTVTTRRLLTTSTQRSLPVAIQAVAATNEQNNVSWKYHGLALAAAAAAVTLDQQRRADCCGIAGVVAGSHHDARYVQLGF
jgi:hypothetical protein